MTRRPGFTTTTNIPVKEFVGAVMLLVIIALFIAHFFGQALGCGGSVGCLEAREELERLTENVNQVCQNSLGGMEEPATLPGSPYDFKKSTSLSSDEPNVFRLFAAQSPTDLPGTLSSFAMSDDIATNWEVKMRAGECDFTHTCLTDVQTCHEGDTYVAWPFYLMGDAKGEIQYYIPEDGRINLRWIDHNLVS